VARHGDADRAQQPGRPGAAGNDNRIGLDRSRGRGDAPNAAVALDESGDGRVRPGVDAETDGLGENGPDREEGVHGGIVGGVARRDDRAGQ
jgi:hypothetical protein